MSQLSTARSDRVVVTVGRLRQVLADFAEQSADLRSQYLSDELERALLLVDRREQRAFLEELRRSYETAYPVVLDPSAHGSLSSSGDKGSDSLVLELLENALLNPTEVPGQSGPVASLSEEEAVHELCVALGINAGTIDPVRAIAMASMMAQFSSSMTTLGWTAWRTIAPNSSVRRGGVTQKLIARYVAGDQAVTREQVAAEIERLRQLIASLISAISQVGEQFARTHLEKFGPVEIEQAVIAENRSGMFRSREVQCWRKYIQLAETLDQSAIESEIRRVIAQHAEHLMRGIGRT